MTTPPSPVPRDDRWQNLVTGAFLLEEQLQPLTEAASDERLRLCRQYLDSALEVFPASLDPVEDFEAYAVRRMLHALRQAIESPRAG